MKITQVQFLKEIDGKNLALLSTPFKTWNALQYDIEEVTNKWLNIAYNYNVADIPKRAYSVATVKGKRVIRGGSSLSVTGYKVYKYDKKYILIKVEENRKFEEFSIKLIIYHCREKLC